MGNSHGKHQKQNENSENASKEKHSVFSVSMRRESKSIQSEKDPNNRSDSESETEENFGDDSSMMGKYSLRRRHAVFAGKKTSQSEPPKSIELDVVYTVPKSKLVVDPFEYDNGRGYKMREKNVKGVENDPQIKSILNQLFTPEPMPRRSWKNP